MRNRSKLIRKDFIDTQRKNIHLSRTNKKLENEIAELRNLKKKYNEIEFIDESNNGLKSKKKKIDNTLLSDYEVKKKTEEKGGKLKHMKKKDKPKKKTTKQTESLVSDDSTVLDSYESPKNKINKKKKIKKRKIDVIEIKDKTKPKKPISKKNKDFFDYSEDEYYNDGFVVPDDPQVIDVEEVF